MPLKDMLGGIQANPDNRHWTAPLAVLANLSQPGTFDAVGGRPPQHLSTAPSADRWIPAFAGPLHKSRIVILLAGDWLGADHAARGEAGELCGSVGGGWREPAAGGDRGAGGLGIGRAAAGAGLRRPDRASVLSGAEPVQGGAAGGLARAGRPGTGGGVGRPAVVPPLCRAGAGPAGAGSLHPVAVPRRVAAAG